MKKLLLTLLLLLSLGFAASAEESSWSVTFAKGKDNNQSNWATNSAMDAVCADGASNFVAITKTSLVSPGQYGLKVGQNKNVGDITFSIAESSQVTPTKIEVEASANKNADKLTFKINGISKTLSSSSTNDTYETIVLTDFTEALTTITFEGGGASSSSKQGFIYINKVTVYYEEGSETPEPTDKIELAVENLVVKAGEQILEDEEAYNLDKDTSIKFTYNTDNTDAAIAYSYSLDLGETWKEGNTYTFTGEDDEYLTVKAASENEVTKLIYLNKWYPASCPAPKISLAVADTEVYAGKVITIDGNGADKTVWNVNGTPIEGTSYTITEAVGTELTFTVTNTTTIRVDGKLQEKVSEIKRTVTVVEKLVATFDFNKDGAYGMTAQSGNSSDYETSITQISDGIATIDFSGSYRLWNKNSEYELRINKNAGNFTVSVPANYYIELITFDGTVSNVTPDKGSLESKKWSYSDQTSSVKFTVGGTRADIKSITVEYAERPTAVVGLTHSVEAKSMTAQIAYTIHVNYHKEGKDNYEVTLTINGKEISSTDHSLVEAPASAMMREAAEEPTSTHKLTGVIAVPELTAHTDYNGTITIKHNDNPVDIEVAPVAFKTMNPTGIEDVTVDGNEAAEYFNLQGVRVAQPEAGRVYIVRRGAKVQKELVK